MNRRILFILLYTIIAITGCNNNSNNEDQAVSSTPEKKLREKASKYPDSLLLKEELIQYFRDNGDYGQAIAETETALKKDPSNDRLWDIKATLHFENADTIHCLLYTSDAADERSSV